MLLVALLLTACNSTTFPPVSKGSIFHKETKTVEHKNPDGKTTSVETTVSVDFQQNDNPKSKAEFKLHENGAVELESGTSNILEGVFTPGTDYTKYVCLVASLAFIALGIFASSKGWPGLGLRFIFAGSAGSVISLTVDSYGWLYAVAVLVIGGVICWEKHHAYTKAENDLKPTTT